MNEYALATLTIIIILGAGFGLLIYFGIDVVTYFGVGLVVASIVGSVIYTWWRSQSDKTIERLKLEILTKIKRELEDVESLVEEASKITDMAPISTKLTLLRENLVKQKFFDNHFNINKTIRKYTLTFIEQEARKVEQRLRSLEALAAGACRPELEKFIKDLQSKLEKLLDAGYGIEEDISEFNIIAAQPSQSLREMIEKKMRLSEKFEEVLDKCVEEAVSVATASRRFGDTSTLESSVLEVKKMKSDFDNAVFLLVKARNELKDILRDVFSRQHSKLISHVKEIYSLLSANHVGEKYKTVIRDIRDELLSLNDPGRIQELRELEREFKNKTAYVVTDLFEEMVELEKNINIYKPHEKVWTSDKKIPELVNKVNPSDELEVFAKNARKALKCLVNQLEKDVGFLKIIENYAKVEPIISRKLNERGVLTISDLNVKYADKFMLLYSLKNEDTTYEEDPPTLTLKSKVAAELKNKLLKKKRS